MAKKLSAAIAVSNLDFSYPTGEKIFTEFHLEIPAQSRTLLVGANGVGKSTLLRIVNGNHLTDREAVKVFGRSPFFEPAASDGIVLVDGHLPLTIDMTLQEILDYKTEGVHPRRQKDLLELLEARPHWKMNRLSDGQRRRVQLLLALRREIKLLLLDEVTSHLDIVCRSDLLNWLKKENTEHGLTIVYTTHILDGLWSGQVKTSWPTHVALLKFSSKPVVQELGKIPDLKKKHASPLSAICEKWIRRDLSKR